MILFGLTGGIASGKSTVTARFQARGLIVLDADRLAREVVAKGSAGLEELRQRFGDSILDPSGELDRKALGAKVFADASERRALEAIVHPRIAMETASRRAALEARGVDLACYDAALLVENRLTALFRPLVVVLAPEPMQRARLMARDGLSSEEAALRIGAQAPAELKRAAADYVIENDGTLEQLEQRTDAVLDALCLALELPLRSAVSPRATPGS